MVHNADIKELRCVAFTSRNRAVSTKKTWRSLLASGYSSVPNKKELPDKNDGKSKLARYAVETILNIKIHRKDIGSVKSLHLSQEEVKKLIRQLK